MASFDAPSCLLAAWLAGACVTARSPMSQASKSPPASDALSPINATSELEPGAVECKLRCESPRMIPRVAPEPDYTQREIDNATAVLSSMRDDLLACYRKRLRVNPKAHGVITVDILVGDDGHVRKVDTNGGAVLGDQTMRCIVRRIEQGVFEPPHGGGNIHVQMPFTLEVVTESDET
jgi:hypothetical protein